MEPRPWHKHYDPGVPASISYEETSIPEFLERTANRFPDRDALIFLNSRLTYRQFQDHVNRFATALANLGVESGSRVAIHLPNLPQTVIAFQATLRLGAHAVMTNPLYTGREIVHQWNDSGATVAVIMDFLWDSPIKPVRDQLPIKHYVVASIPEYLRFPLNLLAPLKLKRERPPKIAKVPPGPGIHFFKQLVNETDPKPPRMSIKLDDVAMLQYTGGTTGVAKGAMLTHRNISCNVQQLLAWMPSLEHGKETLLACLPYFHIYGLTVSMNMPMLLGGTIVLVPNPRDIPLIIKSIVKHRVTLFPAVPAIYNAVNQQPGIEKVDMSSIKVCNSGSAPLPVDFLKRFEELTGGKIIEGYGLTETSPVTHSNPIDKRKVGSIGVPISDTDTKIVDIQTGTKPVAQGEEGELLLRGPQIMKGYWNKPDETAKSIKDGWFYTGDLAVMDEDGYHFIVGRKKDMILASGYNVYPDEIDRVLMSHPAVLEAATIGIPDQKRGETVKSFIVLKPGQAATADELSEYCQQELAAYKVPKIIEFRDALPKSPVLKILRRELRDEELAKRRA